MMASKSQRRQKRDGDDGKSARNRGLGWKEQRLMQRQPHDERAGAQDVCRARRAALQGKGRAGLSSEENRIVGIKRGGALIGLGDDP